MSIKNRIYLSFFILVSLFIINGLVTIVTLNSNNKLSRHISEVIDPSLKAMDNFKGMMIDSKMYTTNWVFLRYSQEDKIALRKLHEVGYPEVKARLFETSAYWENTLLVDSMNKVCTGFEQLLNHEGYIIKSLKTFDDYDNPEKKLGAQEKLETVVLPQTVILMKSLDYIISSVAIVRQQEQYNLEYTSMLLRNLIIFLAVSIILLGIFLSVYMSMIIVTPLNKIQSIINNLGRGIISNVDHRADRNEIGEMIRSVNNLSQKLGTTAEFANEVGNSNFNMSFKPLSAEDTLGIALIAMRDNIKSTNENLRANNDELKKTNAELDRFVYSVSHDLRAPLLSMQGIVGITAAETKEELTVEHMHMINGSITRLDNFIGEILDYSRNARSEMKVSIIRFNELLNEIKGDLKFMSSEKKHVHIYLDIKDEGTFCSDKGRLSIIFNNLISNAIHYYNPDAKSPFVKVSIFSNDQLTRINIEDNGIGISQENQEKIFEMFYRVSENSTGSGLGLYIVKEIVDKFKGEIQIESEPGIGTKFSLSIPSILYQ